jgi:hypothetical protein
VFFLFSGIENAAGSLDHSGSAYAKSLKKRFFSFPYGGIYIIKLKAAFSI